MSDKQGNVPQFSDYEKELLLDGSVHFVNVSTPITLVLAPVDTTKKTAI